jgi:hypothetical protein
MIISLEMIPGPIICSIAEVSINQEIPSYICRYKAGLDDESIIEPFDSVIRRLKTLCGNKFSFSSERILEAASNYYIVYDPSILHANFAGVASPSTIPENRRYAIAGLKDSPHTIVHELIHLAYCHRSRDVSNDFDEINQYYDLENAVEIAAELFLYHIPGLPEDIKNSQIAMVKATLGKYNFLDYMKTPDSIDHKSKFFRDTLRDKSRAFTEEENFDYKGIFNNYYWEEIRASLIDGNFQAPIRQQFLFGM